MAKPSPSGGAFSLAFRPRDLSQRFLEGEFFGEFLARVLGAYERLLEKDWETLLLVAHGGVIRALISFALTGEKIFLGGLEVDPCGLSILDLHPSRGNLLRLHNLTPYRLYPKERASTMELLWAAFGRS